MNRVRPEVQEVCLLAAYALSEDVEVTPIDEGVSTYVYRLRFKGDVFYLRVLPEEGATFAPEVEAHSRLRRSGVLVPEVVYWDDCDQTVAHAVMITREVPGRAIGKDSLGAELPTVVRAAGRDLALINRVPVDGFGWIRRDVPGDARLLGEVARESDFILADLESYLLALQGTALEQRTVDQIRVLVEENIHLLDAVHAFLAHGDFDATHIFSHGGRYTGIIDFGEIRGTGHYYDLGHFLFHDGETLATTVLPYLLEGYADVVPLLPDAERRIALDSLLVGVRYLARLQHRLAPWNRLHAIAAIERNVETLRA